MKVAKEIEKNQRGSDELPIWWDGKQLDEIAFCEWFARKHELMYVGSQFYDIDGFLTEERLSKEILEDIEPYIKSNLTMARSSWMEDLSRKKSSAPIGSRSIMWKVLMSRGNGSTSLDSCSMRMISRLSRSLWDIA